jgi:shikimate kinase
MKIFLIGMPGSGKSTLGRQIAEALLIPFVDLDHEIETREGKSVPEIFSEQGEDYFRQVESSLLIEWASSDKDFVMATGGGAPCFHRGIDIINQSGLSIYFDVPTDELVKRVEKKTNRPLLKTEDNEALVSKINNLLRSRTQVYQRAHTTLHTPDLNSTLEVIRLKSKT